MIFGKIKKFINRVLYLLEAHSDLKVLDRIRRPLGIKFEEKERSLEIHQCHYISEVCNRFKKFHFPISSFLILICFYALSFPISKGSVYSKLSCPVVVADINKMPQLPYRSVLDCLPFTADTSHPDI